MKMAVCRVVAPYKIVKTDRSFRGLEQLPLIMETSLKRWSTVTRLYGATSQKTAIYTLYFSFPGRIFLSTSALLQRIFMYTLTRMRRF
jgi:hypothetical protein